MKIDTLILGELRTNCYIASGAEKSCAIVDPAADAPGIIRFIEENGYTPKYILLTHPHHDHVGAVQELQAHFGVKAAIGAIDNEIVLNPTLMYGQHHLWKGTDRMFTADILLQDGDKLPMDELTFMVYSTPGHTAGGVCYQCGQHIFSGDTLFLEEVGRCDLYGGDLNAILHSVDRLAALPGDYTVYPGHGPRTTLEHERHHNQYIGMLKRNEDFY